LLGQGLHAKINAMGARKPQDFARDNPQGRKEIRIGLKKVILTIAILPIAYFLFPVIMSVAGSVYELNATKEIDKLMERNICIESIKEYWGWYGDSSLVPPIPLALDIKMKNDKRLFLSCIESSFLNGPFNLVMIGENVFNVNVSKNEDGNPSEGQRFSIKFIEYKTGIRLKSVGDVVRNYDMIYEFVNSLETWKDYEEYNKQLDHNISWVQYVRPFLFKGQYWRIINTTNDPTDDTIKNINDGDNRCSRSYLHVAG
jgi:hypothetical protein